MNRVDDIYGDGIGYVALVSTMGDQHTPAEDARMSTDKGRLGPEKDNALQERLLRDAHTSPFEGVVAKVEVCTPLFVLRELDRHRTVDKVSEEEIVTPEENMRKWFARNEMSGRYIQMPNLYYHPEEVRAQSKTNKQGGQTDDAIPVVVANEFLNRGEEIVKQSRALYDWAIENGIEKGQARIYNTQNQYTKIRYTGSLKNWCDMLYLRLPNAVLWECRQIAKSVDRLLSEAFPDAMASWHRNVYDAVRLTKDEAYVINRVLQIGHDGLDVDEQAAYARAIAKLKG
jgi:thymidylate synthase (FAD)